MGKRWHSWLGQPRGLSRVGVVIITAIIVVLGWSIIRAVLFSVLSLLRLGVELGVLVVVFLLIAVLVKKLSKEL